MTVEKHKGKVIFHIDMNSFYASVEQSYQPELKGKPIAIAGNPKERRGILVTCSYEARAKGVYTTMSVWEAKRKCPELLLLPPNFERYRIASKAMFDILRTYTELVEPVSIDEGYMDVTSLLGNMTAIQLAQGIQHRMLHELDLPCSIGIGPNKFLAKTASNMKKPMGITILRIRDVKEKLWHLPVIDMHGIGESTAKKLEGMKIFTIGDLATAEDGIVRTSLGKNGVRLKARANGKDDRAVDPDAIYDTKSVGNSTTLPYDVTDEKELEKTLRQLSEKVSNRLAAKRLASSTITLLMRDAEWHNTTRSITLKNAIYLVDDLFNVVMDLFRKYWKGQAIRLLGVTASNVVDRKDFVQQLSIFNFENHVKEEPIIEVMDALQKKFGKDIITKGIQHTKQTTYESKTSFSKDFLDDHR